MNPYDNPNYCPLFFKGMYTRVSDTTTHVGHCCVSGISPRMPMPDFDHAYLESTRQSWHLAPRKECYQCWETEKHGHPSNRQRYISWLKNSSKDPLTKELLRLEVSVGPVCNAKCITCNSTSSSTWAAEDYNFGIRPHKYTQPPDSGPDQIDNIDVSKLEQLYFTGGEPLLSPRIAELLSHIERNGNIGELQLEFNTNGSILPSDDLVDSWKKCKSVEIYFSLDAVGRAFEYIRNPLTWHKVEQNVRFIKSLGPNIHVKISPTVGVHNIDAFEDIYQWFTTLELPKNALCIHRCWGDLDLDYASESLKKVWRKKLNPRSAWARQLLSMIEPPGGSHNHRWINQLKIIDQRRNFQWQEELPGLAASLSQAQDSQ